jgi:hypothetical protein
MARHVGVRRVSREECRERPSADIWNSVLQPQRNVESAARPAEMLDSWVAVRLRIA